jgi:twinkle protein
LIDKVTRKEVEIDPALYDESVRPKDVVYGGDVKANALNIYKNGFPFVAPIGVPALDELFKLKKGEVTCLTGIGNYGKSTFWKWYQLMRVIKFGERFASFSPEDNPPEEFYHDFVEMLLGCDCTPGSLARPDISAYSNAYDFVSQHIFYVYPKDLSPTPAYIKERFLELVVKEKVDGVTIDPFNQMANDYGSRTDQYLETVLSDFTRFAQANSVFMPIIAHPNKMKKQDDGNYPMPDVFDLAGGAMWNNKMDNIIVYHRPFMQSQPDNPTVEFASKKIRRQKSVGKKGFTVFDYKRTTRRYEFNGIDFMRRLLIDRELTF